MFVIDDIIKFNQRFVADEKYVPYISEKNPKKKLAIVSCMDTRLTELLPAALNIKNGETKIIKTAGAIISHRYGSVMRSLIVAIYGLGVSEVMVIGHTDCGMEKLNPESMKEKMKSRGVYLDDAEVDLDKWLCGFEDVNESVVSGVNIIKNHPLIPKDVIVRGFVMDVNTGKINEIK
jgi:carbonic anhydrase